MSALDVSKLVQEISGDSPAGEDLAYDAAYLELFREAEGTQEQQVGETIIPAEEPDWRQVHRGCLDLLGRTRDLRLFTLLVATTVKTAGLSGLADSLTVLRQNLEQHWDVLYPRLDPDDDNDPLERMNILAALAAAPEAPGDPLRIQKKIREIPLTNSRALGRFSFRDIAVANGDLQPRGEETKQDPAIIDGAFDETPLEELEASAAAIRQALEQFQAMDDYLESTVGAGRMADLAPFRKCLLELQGPLNKALARRGVGSAAADAAGAGGLPAVPGTITVSAPGEIRSHQDVLLALDRICQYYERVEPSSPVPLLLHRAKRLVSRNFVDILNDLSPDSLSQFKLIAGIE
jgi:type VI secretion system protein ImpA